jgi:TolB-like protein/Tfp pilus assembly protein PilF
MKSKDSDSRLRHLFAAVREYLTHWVIAGAIIALTGFAPEHWFADLLAHLSIPESLRAGWLLRAFDFRIGLVAVGVAVVAWDVLRRSRLQKQVAIHDNQASDAVTLALPDKPSIAVLPFQNMSGDTEQDYFTDGMVEDIITALSRFRHLFVIARNSSFTYKGRAVDVKQVGRELGVRYVLEGSVRKVANKVRITAQLSDAVSGHHVWAERYDRNLVDIFAVQDEITERVAGAIEPEVLKIEGGRVATRGATNLSAWDLVRQGTWHFHQVTPAGHARARELFREAIKLDSLLPDSHIWLARVSAGIVAFGWSDNPQNDLQEGLQAAHEALRLDEKDPYSHYALAIISVFSDTLDQAVRAGEEAVEISPSFTLGHFVLGLGRLFSGNAIDSIGSFERGLRLNPYDPQNFVFIQMLALAYYFAGQNDKALQTAIRASKIRPTWQPTLETLTVCYATLDRTEEARACVKQMRELEKPKADLLALLKKHNPSWTEIMATMLRKAGWQE